MLFRRVNTASSHFTKILILTASMGEGHNTAARNIRNALLAERADGIDVLVADPYTRTNPVVNRIMQGGYTMAINRYPRAWKIIFQILSRRGVVEGMGPMLAELTSAVHELILEFQPRIIVSTYPVFSFLISKIRKRDRALTMPFYTVITDSTQINSSWYRTPCDGFFVADESSANVLRLGGVPPDKIHAMGFPVGLEFEKLVPAEVPVDGIWRLLFLPGGPSARAMATLQCLAKLENVTIDVVTGRRKVIYNVMNKSGLPKNATLTGWVEKMPEMMASHHIFIGKAGGATVQEAIAAQIPFLVNHIVPGQEEGNIALIEQSGIGALASGPVTHARDILQGALANDGTLWHAWKQNLTRLRKPSASRAIAQFLLENANPRKTF